MSGAPTLAAIDALDASAPDGAHWDAPLTGAPLVCLDLEMTGLDPEVDRIVEVAAVRRCGSEETRLVSLVAPDRPVGASAAVHGIEDRDLADAPPLASLRGPLEAILEGAVLIGHAIDYDLAFLAAAAERGELAPPPRHALDTRRLARRAWHRPSYSLASLCAANDIETPPHRAEADARATLAVFDIVAAALRALSPRHLWQAQAASGERVFRDDVREVLERAERAGAARISYRVPGRDAFEDELVVHSLDATHVVGDLRGKAGRVTLRGDRMLWAEHVQH